MDSRPGRLGAGTTGSRGRREGVAMAIESRPGRLEAETTGSRDKGGGVAMAIKSTFLGSNRFLSNEQRHHSSVQD